MGRSPTLEETPPLPCNGTLGCRCTRCRGAQHLVKPNCAAPCSTAVSAARGVRGVRGAGGALGTNAADDCRLLGRVRKEMQHADVVGKRAECSEAGVESLLPLVDPPVRVLECEHEWRARSEEGQRLACHADHVRWRCIHVTYKDVEAYNALTTSDEQGQGLFDAHTQVFDAARGAKLVRQCEQPRVHRRHAFTAHRAQAYSPAAGRGTDVNAVWQLQLEAEAHLSLTHLVVGTAHMRRPQVERSRPRLSRRLAHCVGDRHGGSGVGVSGTSGDGASDGTSGGTGGGGTNGDDTTCGGPCRLDTWSWHTLARRIDRADSIKMGAEDESDAREGIRLRVERRRTRNPHALDRRRLEHIRKGLHTQRWFQLRVQPSQRGIEPSQSRIQLQGCGAETAEKCVTGSSERRCHTFK
mmetsp:Transcript_2071/g.5810  ORF Transcript_2071/g.5810 Transcript_2071/m.5810 type:complete len:411 (-) Transcript_2071:67-1299(-)